MATAPQLHESLAPDEVVLIVEGFHDDFVVRHLAQAAGWDTRRLVISPAGGKLQVVRRAEKWAKLAPGRCAILVDLDAQNLPDAQQQARQQLDEPDAEVFCAVPTIEAWLFADDAAVVKHASLDEDVRRLVERLPLPEEIPNPKELAARVFGPPDRWEFLAQVDVSRAAARSPSLRCFLDGLGRMLGLTPDLITGVSRHVTRDVIAGLIREVSPAQAVMWRTATGEAFSAAELQRRVEAGDDIGRQYAADLLRVARDLLRRTAARAGGA